MLGGIFARFTYDIGVIFRIYYELKIQRQESKIIQIKMAMELFKIFSEEDKNIAMKYL